jgi:hypothetical protein
MKFEMNIKRKHLLYLVVLTTIVGGVGLGVAYNSGQTPDKMGHSGEELDVGGATASEDLNMGGNKITKLATPVDLTDAVNLETLQAAAGGGAMPLQGNIIFRDNSNNFGISTIPLSLPKSGCNVMTTVCDYGNNPPTKLILGADPVPVSNPPSASYSGERCGVEITSTYAGGTCYGCASVPGPVCASTAPIYCESTDVCVNSGSFTQCCSGGCSATKQNYQYGRGICCPSDHPIYDPTSGNCVKDTVISTNKVGFCSVLSTTLNTGLTDVTFADGAGNPLSTADYVAVGYSCPAG